MVNIKELERRNPVFAQIRKEAEHHFDVDAALLCYAEWQHDETVLSAFVKHREALVEDLRKRNVVGALEWHERRLYEASANLERAREHNAKVRAHSIEHGLITECERKGEQ